MTDRPILFSGPMVRAILDGRKTQTRRALKPQPPKPEDFPGAEFGLSRAIAPGVKVYSLNNYTSTPKDPTHWDLDGSVGRARDAGYPNRYNARVAIGDRLWVRESWYGEVGDLPPSYAATDARTEAGWRPSSHMPRWASRLTLIVTDVRVQRLQDISEEDAISEGIEGRDFFGCTCWKIYGDQDDTTAPDDPIASFASLWDACYGHGAWDANQWVVATTFSAHHCNIDQMVDKP